MKRRNDLWIPVALIVAAMLLPAGALGEEAPRMTRETLKAAMASNDLVILDVRAEDDWNASEFKITGAVRVDPDNVDAWAKNLSKEKIAVLY